MLNTLQISGVGPLKDTEICFNRDINILTGPKGLGKSFLLDVAWWSLTQTWARGVMAVPFQAKDTPSITYSYTTEQHKDYKGTGFFSSIDQQWTTPNDHISNSSIVIYAGANGNFSVYDPIRNSKRIGCFDFTPKQVLYGLTANDGKTQLCNGLLYDVAFWQNSGNNSFRDLRKIVSKFGNLHSEVIQMGCLVRDGFSVSDMPSICLSYDDNIPFIYAPESIKRIITFLYMLVWALSEHKIACKRLGVKPTKNIIFLIDGIEICTPVQWEYHLVSTVLELVYDLPMQDGANKSYASAQLIASTDSPAVLHVVVNKSKIHFRTSLDHSLGNGKVEVIKN